MATYNFRYVLGRSGPYGFVIANSDEEASEKIREYLVRKGGTLIPDTIVVTTPPRTMPDIEWAVARDRAV